MKTIGNLHYRLTFNQAAQRIWVSSSRRGVADQPQSFRVRKIALSIATNVSNKCNSFIAVTGLTKQPFYAGMNCSGRIQEGPSLHEIKYNASNSRKRTILTFARTCGEH